MKKKIPALIFAAIAVYLLASMSYAATVTSATRTVPEFVDPDTEFDVTVNVEAGDGPITYMLYEKVDDGLTLVSANPTYWEFNNESRQIMWLIMDEKTITYTLRSSVPGTYVFNGNVISGNDSLSVEGDIAVKVRDNCTENWTCEYWSECVGGEQTRECQDNNNCLFPVSTPPMVQECTVEVPPPQDEVVVPPPRNNGGGGSGGGGTPVIITNITTITSNATNTTNDDHENLTVNNTEDIEPDEDENAIVSDDEKENKTESDKITGLVIPGDANKSSGQESEATEITDDTTNNDDQPADTNDMPLLTKALITIIVLAVIIVAIRSR